MITVIPATGTILADILRDRSAAIPAGLSPRAGRQLHTAQRKTPWGSRCQQTYALMKDATALASAECYALQGVIDGRVTAMRGIGSVCGEPSPRGAEAARALIRSLADEADSPIVLLFPSPASDGVAVEGFVAMPTVETVLRVIEATRYGAPMTTVRGGEARDLQAIVAMGRTRALPFRFHLDRDPEFVHYVIASRRLRCGLGPARARELQFFIAEEGVTAAAYVVISATAGHWMIEECGDRDPTGARTGALLQALIAREPSGSRPTIRTVLPAGFLPAQVAAVSTAPTTPAVRIAVRDRSIAPLTAADILYWPNDVL